jgi:hypothetical protein
MKNALVAGAILGGVAGAAVGNGPGFMSGVIVGGVEALIVRGLIVSFGKPALDIVIATLKAILVSVIIAFIAWLCLMAAFQHTGNG